MAQLVTELELPYLSTIGLERADAIAAPAGCSYFFSNAHLLSDNGVKASSPGTVPTSL